MTRRCSSGRVFRRRSSLSATQTAATIPTKHWTAKTSLAAFTFLVASCINWQPSDEHVGLSLPYFRHSTRRFGLISLLDYHPGEWQSLLASLGRLHGAT